MVGFTRKLLLTQISALLLALVLASAAGCSRTAGAEALTFTTLLRGYHSGITRQQALLITDQAAWESYWKEHAAIFVPTPPPPPVDFAAASLIAVNLGQRRTGGYGVTVQAVEQNGRHLRVTAAESRPAPGAMVTMALTQPYHVVRIPRVEPGSTLEVHWESPE